MKGVSVTRSRARTVSPSGSPEPEAGPCRPSSPKESARPDGGGTSSGQGYQIRLDHVEAGSDKETLYAYKTTLAEIQGLWLVPDNRVLSPRCDRDIMAHSVKEGKQVGRVRT